MGEHGTRTGKLGLDEGCRDREDHVHMRGSKERFLCKLHRYCMFISLVMFPRYVKIPTTHNPVISHNQGAGKGEK